jgi:hypothetical protein
VSAGSKSADGSLNAISDEKIVGPPLGPSMIIAIIIGAFIVLGDSLTTHEQRTLVPFCVYWAIGLTQIVGLSPRLERTSRPFRVFKQSFSREHQPGIGMVCPAQT